MAKQGKALPVRRPPERFDDSALLRSAEALGRMIGALQRQLDGAARRLSRSTAAKASSGASLHRSNGHGGMVVKQRKSVKAGARATTRAAKPKAAAARPVKAKATRARAKK
jgi:hypothetical protein